MGTATVNTGMQLEYEVMGPDDGVPLLLVMGFTAQLIAWPDGFCQQLADHGFRVIRFDNRDCGLSTKLDGAPVDLGAVMMANLSGQRDQMPAVPYTLSEMAADAAGLLEHLGIERAHVVGASMGGMIVQHMAIEHAARVASMVSIMSMTGEAEFGSPTPEAAQVLLSPPPTDREAYIERSVDAKVWQSRRFHDPVEVRAAAARSFDRSFYPEGAMRQLAAIHASGSRAEALQNLTTPTLVIHGRDDTLIPPSGGQRTAELVPGATLLLLADMGHDVPAPLWPIMTTAIAHHAQLADRLA
jgi:pimeloyl-ACP methyl ester carboxylesterase